MAKGNFSNNQEKEFLLLTGANTHNLTIHMAKLLRKENTDETWMLEDSFLEVFSRTFPECKEEIEWLTLAKEQGILHGFIDFAEAAVWQQRVHLRKSLTGLLQNLKEYEAVELIESLMFICNWDIEMEIERTWEAPDEEKAIFRDVDFAPAYKEETQDGAASSAAGHSGSGGIRNPYKEILNKKDKSFHASGRSNLGSQRWSGHYSEARPAFTNVQTDASGLNNNQPLVNANGALQIASRKELFDLLFNTAFNITQDTPAEEVYYDQLRNSAIKYERLMNLSMRREVKKAKRGDARAQMSLGEFYAEENTKHTDYMEAARWYTLSAKQGNPKAKLELGKLFDSEKLLEDEEVVKQLNERVQMKSTKYYGIMYFLELAEEGYPTAQSIMGMKYYFGDGVEKNTAKGISWLKKAAKQGHTEAQRQLGEIYMSVDPGEAKKWLKMASASGDQWAKNRLARM